MQPVFAPRTTRARVSPRLAAALALTLVPLTVALAFFWAPINEIGLVGDEMQYDFCGTNEELQGKLDTGNAPREPIFAHTRSANLHISQLQCRIGAPAPASGRVQGPRAQHRWAEAPRHALRNTNFKKQETGDRHTTG